MLNFILGFMAGLSFYISIMVTLIYLKNHEKLKKVIPKRRSVVKPNKVHVSGPEKRHKARANTDSEIWDRENGR